MCQLRKSLHPSSLGSVSAAPSFRDAHGSPEAAISQRMRSQKEWNDDCGKTSPPGPGLATPARGSETAWTFWPSTPMVASSWSS
jgi:hypothetical protein